jgi:hypothetical protein
MDRHRAPRWDPSSALSPSTDGSYLFHISPNQLRAISVPAGYVTTIIDQIMGANFYVSPNPSLGLFVIDNTCVRWYAYSISPVALSSAVIIIGSCGPNSPPASLPTPPVAGSAIRLQSPTCILASTPGTLWVYDSGYGRLLKFTFNSTTMQATLVASLTVVNPIRSMHQDSTSIYVMQEGSCLASRIVENANGTFALSRLAGITEPPSCTSKPFAGVWWTDDGGILRDVFIVTNNSLIFQQAASDCLPVAPQQTSTVTPTATGTSVLPTPTTTSTATTAIPPTSTAAATTETRHNYGTSNTYNDLAGEHLDKHKCAEWERQGRERQLDSDDRRSCGGSGSRGPVHRRRVGAAGAPAAGPRLSPGRGLVVDKVRSGPQRPRDEYARPNHAAALRLQHSGRRQR